MAATRTSRAAYDGGAIGRYFDFAKYGTNFQTEILAGVSTYLSLSYIFIVNPAILSNSGISASAALFATVVASSLATIAMGLWARLPFAVAPGLEMNGFFAFVVCGTAAMGLTWQQGLGTVFISGLLCIFFTVIGIRHRIIESIPIGLKKAIGTSVGVFVATIGLFLANIVVFKDGHIDFAQLSMAAFGSHLAIVLYVGLALSLILSWPRLHFPAGMLVAIIVGAVLCAYWQIRADHPPALSRDMFQAVGKLDLGMILVPAFWSAIIIFFIIDFIGGIGKFIGLTASTNIQDADGNVPNIGKGLIVDGAGTSFGALLGTSSLIAFVESAVGIKAGGRTGLTALVCGLLMAGSIVFTPMLQWVPAQAAAGVLIYVGWLLLPRTVDPDGTKVLDKFDLIVAGLMGLLTFATFSLDKSLALGFGAYFVKGLVKKGSQKEPLWLLGLFAILVVTIIWQLMIAA
jgi:AGZA family xanthine/uracil permease-like MFS transporter